MAVDREHVLIIAVEVEADGRDAAREAVYASLAALPGTNLLTTAGAAHIESWWHAEPDRTDRSDRDNARFESGDDFYSGDYAVLLDASQVREECEDQYSSTAALALATLSNETINRYFADEFGDDFWNAVMFARQNVIERLLDDLHIPDADRRDP